MGHKRLTTMRIDGDLLKKAHDLGLNVSKITENALVDAINRMEGVYIQDKPEKSVDAQPKREKVAHERFELSSPGPKPDMLDHYTNGLHSHTRMCGFIYC